MPLDINIMPGPQTLGPQDKTKSVPVVRQILQGETYATVLVTLFADMLGDEKDHEGKPLGFRGFQWHPQTINEYVEDHWGVKLPKQNFDKLMAGIAIVTTDLFFRDVDRFIKLCNVLAGSDFDHETFDPADAVDRRRRWRSQQLPERRPPAQRTGSRR